MQGGFKSRRPKSLKYWIAVVSYIIILFLSIFCLAAYVPGIPEETRPAVLTFLIGFLIVGTMAISWEMIHWRKERNTVKKESIDDVVRKLKDDANSK